MIGLFSDIKGNGPPTKDTPGAVGQYYLDRDTGLRYECTESFIKNGYGFSKTIYTWEKRGFDIDYMATDAEVAKAIDDLREQISQSGGGGSGTILPVGGISIWAELIDDE